MKSERQYEPVETYLRQYLLGQLSVEELSRFEEQLMSDDDLFLRAGEAAETVEDELAGEYASGVLEADERNAFEQRLARSRKLKQKVRFERELAGYAKKQRRESLWTRLSGLWAQVPLKPAYVGAMAAIILAVGGGWSMYRVSQLERRLHESLMSQARQAKVQAGLELQIAQQRSQIARLGRELEQVISGRLDSAGIRQMASVVAFVLKPGLVRSGGATAVVRLHGEEQTVELRLDIGLDEFRSYRATLADASGLKLIDQFQIPAGKDGGGVHVALPVPAKVLRAGDYSVVLHGEVDGEQAERIDSYHFRISRQ
jgi:uncharacterized coiled-coil protein SlyX